MSRPGAILVSTTEDTAELEELLYSLGYNVTHRVIQKRGRPDPATFLGSGKLEELQDWLVAHGAKLPKGAQKGAAAGEALQRAERAAVLRDAGAPEPHEPSAETDATPSERARGTFGGAPAPRTPASPRPTVAASGKEGPPALPKLVAINANLKANQIAALERKLGIDCYDRVRIILEIFTQRAHTQEARLQVELARLRYERPLVREYIHLSKKGEHPGFMAGGAYAVDTYYTQINGRISKITEELKRIGEERELRRKHRRKGGFHLVSLAGYTNAGKSSLLKRLSGEDVLVENRMFSTLETRTGRARVGGQDVLVTDTVGFVEGLPPDLVKAFRSTLEEIAHADLIVLVVDGSDAPPEVSRKLKTSLNVLREFGDLAPLLIALNKADRVSPEQRAKVDAAVQTQRPAGGSVWLSALQGEGVDALVERILEHVPPLQKVRLKLPLTSEGEALLGDIYLEGTVEHLRRGEELDVTFLAPTPVAGSLLKRAKKVGGHVPSDTPASVKTT